MRAWVRDLALGARFAVAGGPSGWARTALTTIGVGLGVVVLLLAAAVPHLLSAQDARESAREPSCMDDEMLNGGETSCYLPEAGPDTLLLQYQFTEYHDTDISGSLLQPDAGAASTATPPPGVEAFPGPGEMVVSPALGRLLDSEDGALLAERLDYDRVGTIADEGLTGSGELAFYAGTDALALEPGSDVMRIDSFGRQSTGTELNAPLMLLLVVICVALLMPVAVFIATAVRFGGERRDRRLAALRLVGADTMSTRRIAAGETLVGALGGVLLGLLALLPLRQYLGGITVFGFSTIPGDFVPSPVLTALILLGVPFTAVVVTLFALRQVAIEPLGVFRQVTPRKRRLTWRLVPGLMGVALLVPLASGFSSGSDLEITQAAVGIVLVLAGVTLLLPWAVERLVGMLRSGPVSWQLAVRRIQLSSGAAARPVTGITVAVAGATALYMLFAGVRAEETVDTGQDTERFQVEATASGLDEEAGVRFRGDLVSQQGVTGSLGWTRGSAVPAGEGGDWATTVVVADCGALRELLRISSCADGDTFRAPPPGERLAEPGDRLDLNVDEVGDPQSGEPRLWAVPGSARTAEPRQVVTDYYLYGIFVTPSALDVDAFAVREAWVQLAVEPSDDDAVERVRNVVWPYAEASVWEPGSERVSSEFAGIQTGLLIGASGVMLLIGASMIVSMVEQLRERKRLLSVLVAFGTRRVSLGASVLWQTAIPVALGLAMAAVVGTGLGALLMAMVDLPVTDWLAFLPMVGVGAGVIALVTLASLPLLWRLMRPDGLRTE
jgi:FtsX-like permease family protein